MMDSIREILLTSKFLLFTSKCLLLASKLLLLTPFFILLPSGRGKKIMFFLLVCIENNKWPERDTFMFDTDCLFSISTLDTFIFLRLSSLFGYRTGFRPMNISLLLIGWLVSANYTLIGSILDTFQDIKTNR